MNGSCENGNEYSYTRARSYSQTKQVSASQKTVKKAIPLQARCGSEGG
jgi:hypothetical protein